MVIFDLLFNLEIAKKLVKCNRMNDTVHGLHIGGLPMQFDLPFHGCTAPTGV